MPQDNLISINIPPEDVQAVMDAIAVINTKLKPHLVALSKEERKALPKMGDRTIPFVDKVIEYASAQPEFVPAYMNLPELRNDFNGVSTLNQMYRPLEQVVSNLNDTLLLSGSEAYKAALQFYNYVKQAAKNNVPDAKVIYEELKKRFEGQSVKTEPTT
jgi:hypothetical protein